jgi:Recombination endonuclease VII
MRDGHRSDCKTCNLAAKKAWYEQNRDQAIAKVTAWQRENRERYNNRQREYKRARPGLERAGHLRRKFGLTTDEFEEMVRQQGGVCAICGRAPKTGKRLHVDHDHDTGEVRGLLCFSCNVGVGNLGNDIERLQRTVDYLETRPEERAELEEVARERARALMGVA